MCVVVVSAVGGAGVDHRPVRALNGQVLLLFGVQKVLKVICVDAFVYIWGFDKDIYLEK